MPPATPMFVRTAAGRRALRIDPARPLGEGGAATIFADLDDRSSAVKLYKPGHAAANADKVAAMLANPPAGGTHRHAGETWVQIAWPQAIVEDERGGFLGFTMPLVDGARSAELEQLLTRRGRAAAGLSESGQFRLFAARNVAAIIAELHKVGHHVIDMKPQNLRVFRQTGFIAVLDCDGCDIQGGTRRYPATLFTPLYTCPEAQGLAAGRLGREQDLFALAVIIFQLLNNGLHPFAGRPAPGRSQELPGDVPERIGRCLYAYGRSRNPVQQPAPQSIHDVFERRTHRMFDRAFVPGRRRPTAAEWRDHLHALMTTRLVQCRRNPDHWHFSKGCGQCALEDRLARRVSPGPAARPAAAVQVAVPPAPAAPHPPPQPPAQPLPQPAVPAPRLLWPGLAAAPPSWLSWIVGTPLALAVSAVYTLPAIRTSAAAVLGPVADVAAGAAILLAFALAAGPWLHRSAAGPPGARRRRLGGPAAVALLVAGLGHAGLIATLPGTGGTRQSIVRPPAGAALRGDAVRSRPPARPPRPEAGGDPAARAEAAEARVRYAQSLLAELGHYQGGLDGVAGPRTQQALRDFIAARRLTLAPQIDEAMIAALERARSRGARARRERPPGGRLPGVTEEEWRQIERSMAVAIVVGGRAVPWETGSRSGSVVAQPVDGALDDRGCAPFRFRFGEGGWQSFTACLDAAEHWRITGR